CFRVRNRTLDRLNFLEGLATRTEQLLFECGQSGEHAAGTGGACADTWVARCKLQQIRADISREHSGHEHHRTACEYLHSKSTPCESDVGSHVDRLGVEDTSLTRYGCLSKPGMSTSCVSCTMTGHRRAVGVVHGCAFFVSCLSD